MRCQDFLQNYSAYRDGLDARLAADMEDHLEVCPSCANFDRAVREGVELLQGEVVRPSPDFMERLQARLLSEPAPPADDGHFLLPITTPRLSPLMMSAVMLLAALLVAFTLKPAQVVTPAAAAERPDLVSQPRLMAGIPFVAFDRLDP